jgi:DNA-binding transcriptional MerR regulator
MQAGVGIAMGGTDIAVESADVIIVRDDLHAIMGARQISARSHRTTKQNVALAFLFNGIGIPLAATGLVYPVWATRRTAMTDAQPTDPYMRIGQLADRFGLNTKTIRYYEDIGLLPEPERTAAGYRLYAEADADRLRFIKTAQRLSLTLDDIREILAFKERSETPCDYVRGLLRQHAQDLARRIAEMQALRDELLVLVDRAQHLPTEGRGYCGLIEHQLEETTARPGDQAAQPRAVDATRQR